MEFDDLFAPRLTARERMEARHLMANNPDIFGIREGCEDCETLNEQIIETAEEVIQFGTELATVAQSLCYFKDQCKGAERAEDGTWTGCGSRTTPIG